jgi:hypothetical protein
MANSNTLLLAESAIQQINSLGGPPLPAGVSTTVLKVILENRAAAAQALPSSSRIAGALALRCC